MSLLFSMKGFSIFNNGDILNWDTSSVDEQPMAGTFRDATSL